MSNQQALVGSADAQQHLLDKQVNLFLFDLKNEASEHGFKPGESWTLELVTEGEMAALKKIHHPIVSLRLTPHGLLKAYQQIKSSLQQPLNKNDMALTAGDIGRDEKKTLVAYPLRHIRN